MKIAIIGAGWVGCHLARTLMVEHDVKLFDKSGEVFNQTSSKNQNRLHLGFHYPRNSTTRNLCQNTFTRFLDDYGFITEKVDKNFYCVPYNDSLLDFDTYKLIFNEIQVTPPSCLNNIEGCIITNEMFINFEKAKSYFTNELKNILIKKNVSVNDLLEMSRNYDFVIDATNNTLNNEHENFFYELALTLLYKKEHNAEFGALTLMDGNLFSIYPYKDNLFTITDVEHTPIIKTKNIQEINNIINNLPDNIINEKQKLIENKISCYYPNFKKDFIYNDFILSIKSKIISKSDNRYPIIVRNNNIIKCFTGKIQGIYIISDFIKELIKNAA